MKPILSATHVFSMLAVFMAAVVLADSPIPMLDGNGEYTCAIVASGSSSKDYVDIDTPHITAGHMFLLFDRGRLFLGSRSGTGTTENERWSALIDEMTGGEVAYQIGEAGVDDLVLPLTWIPKPGFGHVPHDGEVATSATPYAALFDITRTALGRFLLQQVGNPPKLTLKHSALIDHGYLKPAALRYRVENVITTITFLHYKDAMAYCERANDRGDGGLFQWLD